MFDQWAHVSLIHNPPIDILVHYGKGYSIANVIEKTLIFGDGNEEFFQFVT